MKVLMILFRKGIKKAPPEKQRAAYVKHKPLQIGARNSGITARFSFRSVIQRRKQETPAPMDVAPMPAAVNHQPQPEVSGQSWQFWFVVIFFTIVGISGVVSMSQRQASGDVAHKFVDEPGVAQEPSRTTSMATATTPSFSSKHRSASSGRHVRGPRGGCYTVGSGGRKHYVDRSVCGSGGDPLTDSPR